jgi:hypothetical protein
MLMRSDQKVGTIRHLSKRHDHMNRRHIPVGEGIRRCCKIREVRDNLSTLGT